MKLVYIGYEVEPEHEVSTFEAFKEFVDGLGVPDHLDGYERELNSMFLDVTSADEYKDCDAVYFIEDAYDAEIYDQFTLLYGANHDDIAKLAEERFCDI